jgi:hypothetical protein
MALWGKKSFLDPHVEAWHRDCWAWLTRLLDEDGAPFPQPLVLPTREFFPPIEAEGHARAEAVLERVKTLMGLENWPCVLVERQETNAQIGEFLVTMPQEKAAAGTFEVADGAMYITYAPKLLTRPLNLVATFAHELAHYVLHSIEELPPGADEEPGIEELATELAVAGFGFGVIAANASFDFQQFSGPASQGWQGGAWGYFSEAQWTFALAAQLRATGTAPDAARTHLKPHLAKSLDAALKRIDETPDFMDTAFNKTNS